MQKDLGILCAALVLAAGSSAQLSVSTHALDGTYSANAFSGSTSGILEQINEDGYLEVISEAALGDELGLQSANFFGVLQSTTIADGFRVAGFIDADEPATPFYSQSHDVFASVRFELAVPTEIRIAGMLAHNPSTGNGAIALLNGTSFEIRDADTGGVVPFAASVSPIGGSDQLDIDETITLPAGAFVADLTSFSRMGLPFSPGLLDVKVSWDLSITVVPAPGAIGLVPIVLLASRRRR